LSTGSSLKSLSSHFLLGGSFFSKSVLNVMMFGAFLATPRQYEGISFFFPSSHPRPPFLGPDSSEALIPHRSLVGLAGIPQKLALATPDPLPAGNSFGLGVNPGSNFSGNGNSLKTTHPPRPRFSFQPFLFCSPPFAPLLTPAREGTSFLAKALEGYDIGAKFFISWGRWPASYFPPATTFSATTAQRFPPQSGPPFFSVRDKSPPPHEVRQLPGVRLHSSPKISFLCNFFFEAGFVFSFGRSFSENVTNLFCSLCLPFPKPRPPLSAPFSREDGSLWDRGD